MQKSKNYDLEDGSFEFAKNVRAFIKLAPKTISNMEDGKQAIRTSGSVGTNYIEANESLSKKDLFLESKFVEKRQRKVNTG